MFVQQTLLKAAIVLLVSLGSAYASAADAPRAFTLQGKIYQSDGVMPLESDSATFKVQILSPDGACVLFEETHWRDMTGTAGIFTLPVGDGINTGTTSATLLGTFSNLDPIDGAGGCSYTPVAGDSRLLRFSYNDGDQIVDFPSDQIIRSVPYAMHADSLEGLSKDAFIQVSSSISQRKIDMLGQNYAALMSLASGEADAYIKSSDLALTDGVLDLATGGVVVADTPAASSYAINKNYADSKLGGLSLDVAGLSDGARLTWSAAANKWVPQSPASALTSISVSSPLVTDSQSSSPTISLASGSAAGQTLTWGGSSWTSAFLGLSDLRNASGLQQIPSNCTSAETMVFQSPTNTFECALIEIGSHQVSGLGSAAGLSAGTEPNDVVQLDGSGRLPAVDGSQLTNLKAAGWVHLGSGSCSADCQTTGSIDIAAKKQLMIVISISGKAAPGIAGIMFNGHDGYEYWDRHMFVAAGSSTWTNVENSASSGMRLAGAADVKPETITVYCSNLATSTSKTCSFQPMQGTGTPGQVGSLGMGSGEWTSPADTQITSIELRSATGAALLAGTGFTIFGKDF